MDRAVHVPAALRVRRVHSVAQAPPNALYDTGISTPKHAQGRSVEERELFGTSSDNGGYY